MGRQRAGDEEPLVARKRRRRAAILRIVLWVVVLSVAYSLVPADRASTSSAALRGAFAIVLTLGAVVWQIVVALSQQREPDETIVRLMLAVPLVMFGFATSYLFMSHADAASFSEDLNHLDAVYFSLTTMTSVGFGDITPRSGMARTFVMAHMAASVVIVGVAVHLVRRTIDEVRVRRQSE